MRTLSPLAYGRMKQRNDHYDGGRMQELHDLSKGGYALQRKARGYLRLVTSEHQSRFEERCATTAYINYFGQIVSQFCSDLFAQPLSIMAPPDADDPQTPGEMPDSFYKEFERDADCKGTLFVDLMSKAMATALVQRTAFICVDAKAPDAATPPASRAEEEASGALRFYAYEESPRSVIDWKEDDAGAYEWLTLNRVEQDRPTPYDLRDEVTETFVIWTMEARGPIEPVRSPSDIIQGMLAQLESGEGESKREPRLVAQRRVACWRKYEIRYNPDKPPTEKDLVVEVASGQTSFTRIPVIRMELPEGLWVGDLIGQAGKEHWQRRSCRNAGVARSMAAIPVIARGSEIGQRGGPYPSETQQDPDRGADPMGRFQKVGYVETGAEDKVYYAEPEGRCYEIEDKSIDELKDEIFRVVHMMAASVKNSASSMGRSGASKQQDGKATSLVLRALGGHVRKLALEVYDTIGKARGDEVLWVANGLDNYDLVDREQVLAESIQLDLVDIPSETFAKTHAQQVAEKLLTGLSPETLDQIRKEIEEGTTRKFAQRDLENDARQGRHRSRDRGGGGARAAEPGFRG
jgi:hypothetical protein